MTRMNKNDFGDLVVIFALKNYNSCLIEQEAQWLLFTFLSTCMSGSREEHF